MIYAIFTAPKGTTISMTFRDWEELEEYKSLIPEGYKVTFTNEMKERTT